MSKSTIVSGVVALVIIAALGFLVYQNKKDSTGGVMENASTTTNTTNSPNETTQEPGAPQVTTSSDTRVTNTSAHVNGTVTIRGGLTVYWYEYGSTAALGSKTNNQVLGAGFITTQAPGEISGLTNNTQYYFRLVAENPNGKTYGATQTFQTSYEKPPQVVGSKPTAKTSPALGITRTSAVLVGEIDPHKAVTRYWFEYGKTEEFGNTTDIVTSSDSSSMIKAEASISSLDPETTYYVRLNAQNQFGTANGDTLTFKTKGPALLNTLPFVSTLAATKITNSSAVLAATVETNDTETTYWFEYDTDAAMKSSTKVMTEKNTIGGDTKKSNVNVTVRDLRANTTYYVKIVAQNKFGVNEGEVTSFKTK